MTEEKYSKKVVTLFTVTKNNKINKEFFILQLKSDNSLPKMYPGQFAQVLVDNKDTFLRRPISIHLVDYESNEISLLIKIVGKGTQKLSEAESGDIIDVVLPLGNSFQHVEHKNPLLIGGGTGIAPILYMAKELHKKGIKADIIMGARRKDLLLDVSEFENIANIHITTEDGSSGHKGFVTQHPIILEKEFDIVYTCGPEPMMKAIAEIAEKYEMECQVSLENMMACGFGVCLCCIVKTNEGNICTCTEGPVFNAKDIKW